MHSLVPHSDCASGPIQTVSADIVPTDGGCRARFRFEGNIAQIRIPNQAHSDRTDNLWKTTCCEIFWQPRGDTAYREFNFSPSSQWACYGFDDYRVNSRNAPVQAVAIASSHTDSALVLEVGIAADLTLPANIALTAVVEGVDGAIQYWAQDFADGKPDFHNAVCRAIALEAL